MLTQDVIVPSESPWASPVVLVRKKDRGVWFCIHYRKLNGITKLDEFPLLRIDDTLDLLSGAKYFTTLDLASGYWQVPMEPSSQEKTAFTTHCGLYEFKKMPVGLVNAPATFQRFMEAVFSGLARGVCHVYLDDVLPQKCQKNYYDKRSTSTPFRDGERVFLYKPAEKTGEARKLARPFHGPYRITNTATIIRVGQPEEEPLLVILERLRRCPGELPQISGQLVGAGRGMGDQTGWYV